MEKHCPKCGITKTVDDFYNNCSRHDGKHTNCKPCMNAAYKPKTKDQACRDTINYAKRHPEKVKAAYKKWYEGNRDSVYERSTNRNKRPDVVERNKARYKENFGEIKERKKVAMSHRTPWQKAEKKCRDRFSKVLRQIKTGRKLIDSEKFIGCSIDFYKVYIEEKFTPGMSWINHGYGEHKWNIDHILPLCSFDLTDMNEAKKCFHYTNTRPLWFQENITRTYREHKRAS